MTKKTEKLESDGAGNRFLPGTEPKAKTIVALRVAVMNFRLDIEPNYKTAKKKYDGYKKLIAELITAHHRGFSLSDDGTQIYNDGMVEVVVSPSGKVKYSIIDDSRKDG